MRMCLFACFGVLLAAAPMAQSPAASRNAPTFHKDVLPILQANCQTCHRPGEVAPMSLLTFEQTRPWARAIKTAVTARTMPPWFADPNFGHFANERRLSEPRDRTRSTRGSTRARRPAREADAPPPLTFENGWNIKPDVIVEMPKPFELPARGTINYKYVLVEDELHRRHVGDGGRNAAGQLQGPASRQGLGGAARIDVDGEGGARAKPTSARAIARSWGTTRSRKATTSSASSIPDSARSASTSNGAAKFIPKGSDLVFELHYTTSGEPTSDVVEAGTRAREGAAADPLLLPRRPDRDEPRDSAPATATRRSSARSRSAKTRGSSTRSRTCICAARTSSCASSRRAKSR